MPHPCLQSPSHRHPGEEAEAPRSHAHLREWCASRLAQREFHANTGVADHLLPATMRPAVELATTGFSAYETTPLASTCTSCRRPEQSGAAGAWGNGPRNHLGLSSVPQSTVNARARASRAHWPGSRSARKDGRAPCGSHAGLEKYFLPHDHLGTPQGTDAAGHQWCTNPSGRVAVHVPLATAGCGRSSP